MRVSDVHRDRVSFSLCTGSDSAQLTPIFLAHTFTHIFLRCDALIQQVLICAKTFLERCRPKNETLETMIQLPKAIHLTQLLIEAGTALLFPVHAYSMRLYIGCMLSGYPGLPSRRVQLPKLLLTTPIPQRSTLPHRSVIPLKMTRRKVGNLHRLAQTS